MRIAFGVTSVALCIVSQACLKQPTSPSSVQDNDHNIRILERIEQAGNRYRTAIDLVKYGSSTLERSLADSHLQLTRSILESEFQLAEVESKYLALSEPATSTSSQVQGDRGQYEKAAAEVWRIYGEVEEAGKKLEAARQSLKTAATAEGFRRGQQAVDRAQKELEIANKKLDLSGSNLDIEEYRQMKKLPEAQMHSLDEHLKELREELIPSSSKSNTISPSPPKTVEDSRSSLRVSPGGGIVGSFRELFRRQGEVGALNQAYRESSELLDGIKERLLEKRRTLEELQTRHMELNRQVQAAYDRIYELLKTEGTKTSTAALLQEADRQMGMSSQFDQKKEFNNRALATIRRQANLLEEDGEKLATWLGLVRQERLRSLSLFATRLGIVLALVGAILLIAYYLKKLPYRFIKESKNLYYLQKIIGFSAGLLIVVIILLNFVGDFGSISAAIGLAGAGLAIALQDPIVSLVGWFLIIGKSGIAVGDRVEINNVKGDVIDVGLLRTAVLEVGNWVSGEQATGRVVFFPNSFIFKNHFFNYSTGNSFIWDEIDITVTYESDWKRAKEIIESVAQPICKDFVQGAKASQAEVSRRFHINLGTLTPTVYVSIAESGVELMLRYLTEIRRRRGCRDEICREVLKAFDTEPHIDLAYPTRRSLTEARVPPAPPEIPANLPASKETIRD